MSAFHDMMLAGSGGQAGGGSSYQIARSLRFNSPDSAYLSRTPSVAGNRKTWTWAGWVKRSRTGVSNTEVIFQAGVGSSGWDDYNYLGFRFTGSDALDVITFNGAARKTTTQVFRDTSAWYHVVISFDTTQSTASNRIRIYINGNQVTTFSTDTAPAQNTDYGVNGAWIHSIGREDYAGGSANAYFSGYLADVHFIDGQALTPTSFGQFDANNVWQPKAYSGTYGTNGFRLDFSDNSNTTAATLGADRSGNGNNWTPTNFSVSTSNVNYSATGTISGTGFNTGGPIGNVFDGSTSTRAYANQTGYATYTFASPVTVSSSLRIYASSNQSGAYSSFYVNGNIVSIGGAGWYTINGVSSLQSFTVGHGAASISDIYAIEVDGSILVDNAGIGNDSLVDSPTNYGTDTGAGGEVRGNYCTLNPLLGTVGTLSNGNLDGTTGSTINHRRGTFGVTSGKWYWEFTANSASDLMFGVVRETASFTNASTGYPGGDGNGWGYYQNSGTKYNGLGAVAYGASYTTGDIIGVALDADAGTLTFYKNGVSQGQAFNNLTSGPFFPAIGNGSAADRSYSCNFGQRPFAYAAPSGFKALCSTNLPTPTIPNGRTAMDVVTYTGNGGTQTISGLSFSPDLVWIKSRTNPASGYNHFLVDAVRGSSSGYLRVLFSNTTDSEDAYPGATYGGVSSLDSTGFSLAANSNAFLNNNTTPYVAWTWDAGTTTVTNTAGTITSQVRANASAGISIVSYTGNGVGGATVGHGLGVAPSFFIIKERSQSTGGWIVYHSSLTATSALYLNLTVATQTASSFFNNTSPTSTVFSLGGSGELNDNGQTNIAYCFAPVSGFSAFGSYTGNGSADGVFVYTGFRPRWIMLKWYSGTISNPSNAVWLLFDSAREPANKVSKYVSAESSAQEYSDASIDFLSNGFKLRDAGDATNRSAGNYIYAAFSENPFSIARAR